mgnify:CR=1 FL=1
MCVCRGKTQGGSINGIPWSNNCEPFPATTILRDHNPSCAIETYGGAPEDFPPMQWPTNYFKLAAATMFTLFFGGKRFAPGCCVARRWRAVVRIDIRV